MGGLWAGSQQQHTTTLDVEGLPLTLDVEGLPEIIIHICYIVCHSLRLVGCASLGVFGRVNNSLVRWDPVLNEVLVMPFD